MSLTLSRSVSAYTAWQSNLVMTTIATTGLPVSVIDYPGVVICSQGSSQDIQSVAFANHIIQFLRSKKIKVTEQFNMRTMSATDQAAWITKWGVDYIKENFPGLAVGQSPLDLIQLMTSGMPDALIMSEVARSGGYDPCKNGELFTKVLDSLPTCPSGYETDTNLSFCYRITQSSDTSFCAKDESNLLLFYTDQEVAEFTDTLSKQCFNMQQGLQSNIFF